MPLGIFERWVWYLNIAAALALEAKLLWFHQVRTYRALFFYLLADSIEQFLEIAFLSNPNGYAYGIAYFAGQSLKVVLAVWIVLDLYRLGLEAHPALAKFGRRTIWYLFGAAVLLSAPGLWLESSSGSSPVLREFLRFERTMDSISLILVILISVFLLWFPVKAPRNVVLYIAGFSLYYFERWAGLLLINIWPELTRTISPVMLVISFVCLAAWLLLLRREEENTTTVTGHRWNREEAERLSGHLDAINTRLLHFAKE